TYIYQNLYIQFRNQPRGINTGRGFEYYDFGASIPKADALRREIETIQNIKRNPRALLGKQAMVFDIETLGLGPDAGVRQVSAGLFNIGGSISQRPAFDPNFRVALGQLGYLHTDRGYQTINQFLEGSGKI